MDAEFIADGRNDFPLIGFTYISVAQQSQPKPKGFYETCRASPETGGGRREFILAPTSSTELLTVFQ